MVLCDRLHRNGLHARRDTQAPTPAWLWGQPPSEPPPLSATTCVLMAVTAIAQPITAKVSATAIISFFTFLAFQISTGLFMQYVGGHP